MTQALGARRLRPGLSLLAMLVALPAWGAPLSVDTSDRQASIALYQSIYAPGAGTRLEWYFGTDACSPGTTSDYYRDAALERVNYFRAMAGVPSVTFNDTYNRRAQAAAYVMGVNEVQTHELTSNLQCYSQDAFDGASRSNVFLYRSGLEAIDGYIRDDGPFNAAVGHRRWMLHPPTQQMGIGDVPAGVGRQSANALYVIDGKTFSPHPATRDGFVAWPPPGYVPYDVAYPRWHFSQNGADLSAASVSVTLGGRSVPVAIESRGSEYNLGYVEWRLNNMDFGASFPRPATDQTYTVTIRNALISGQSRTISYDVTLIDPVVIDGDYNFDGVVDAADYTVVRDGLGDGFTTADIQVWRASYGDVANENATAIPEPLSQGSCGIALLVAACAPARRPRPRGR